jgi:hypothetical protein
MVSFQRARAVFIPSVLCLVALVDFALGQTRGVATVDAARSSSTQATRSTSISGVFKTDRGDFSYNANYWPDDGAKYDRVARAVVTVMKAYDNAKTVDEKIACYSPEAILVMKARNQMPKASGLASGGLMAQTVAYRVRRIVTTTNIDGSETCFVEMIIGRQASLPGPPVFPAAQTIYVEDATLNPFRLRGDVATFDYPAENNPVYEALQFDEWDRFGLPQIIDKDGPATTRPDDR